MQDAPPPPVAAEVTPAPASPPAPVVIAPTSSAPVDLDASGPPAAATGFQLSTGFYHSRAVGRVASGDEALATVTPGTTMFHLGLGGKITTWFYLGGYLDAGGGSLGDTTRCPSPCNPIAVRIGIEARVYFAPAARVSPWASYGIGGETLGLHPPQSDDRLSLNGAEFARLAGGVDFRISRGFGIGPFVGGSIAQYASTTLKVSGIETVTPIGSKALHGWLTLGFRIVVFP